jgi:hypothetical protein
MTAAYLTELEIIKALHLPEKVGREKLAMWKLDPTFPQPEPGTGGRRFWPLVEEWLRQHHGVGATTIVPVAEGRENFDGFRERRARKAGKAKGPRNAGPRLAPADGRMDCAVVTPFRPSGARALSKEDAPPVATIGHRPNSA